MALTVLQVRVTNIVLSTFASILTFFRLWDRARSARLWWDDFWAFLTMVFLFLNMADLELHLQGTDPNKYSRGTKLGLAYTLMFAYYLTVWSARMSILLTVIRLSAGRFRRVLVWSGGLFAVFFVFLFLQIWWNCERHGKVWADEEIMPQCPLELDVVICQVVADVISDAILIFMPLRLVMKAKLTKAQKIRIGAIFSTTILTTAFAVNHAYFVFKGGIKEALAAILQVTTSLLVVNLSVLVAWFFRITTEDEDTAPHWSPPKALSFVTFRGTRRSRNAAETGQVTTRYHGTGETKSSDGETGQLATTSADLISPTQMMTNTTGGTSQGTITRDEK